MTPYITEMLKEISDNPELLSTKYKDSYPIKVLLQYAYDTRFKMQLPEGEPPYIKDASPLGMSPANFYQQVKKLYVFGRKDLQPVRREQLFIQLLEGLHPSEANVLIHVKDQKIDTLYPGITVDVVIKAGIVEEQHAFRSSTVQNPTGGRTLVVNLSDTAVTKEQFGAPPPPIEAHAPVVQEVPVKRGRGRPRKNP